MRQFLIVLFSLVALSAQAVPAPQSAAVAMPDSFAAEAAAAVLSGGGNAVDAAVTAAFVLAVTYPEAGNIGGGGFLLTHMEGEAAFLDFRETAAAAAYRNMYLDDMGQFVPQRSLVGGLAPGVPGTVAGLAAAHKRFGSLPWHKLLVPAISLAEYGFPVPRDLANYAASKVEEIDGATNFDAFFGDLRAGRVFRQPELARTLRRIAATPDDFYRGITARLLVEQVKRSGGIITAQDLKDYQPVWREPLRLQWRDHTLLAAPPPSSGGLALAQLLGMFEAAQPLFDGVAHNSAGYVHRLAEIEKRVFADRAEYLGDPDFVDVPVAALMAPEYLARRAAQLQPASISLVEAVPAGLESTDTTHFSIVDGEGNAVSLTYTLNWDFGSGVVVEGAGFLLNNEMDDFSAKPGVPNAFGVIGNDNNAIAPGKRMLSSMSPTIVLTDNRPALVLGSPGGSTIFTSVFQVILNAMHWDMPLADAVNSTRFHHQLPQAFLIRHDQRSIPAATATGLREMGYAVEANSWGNLGDVQAISVATTGLQAAADERGRGVALVVPLNNTNNK